MADRAPDDLVLVRRDDLRTAFTAAKFYGALTSPRADRLEVAVNGEAATVDVEADIAYEQACEQLKQRNQHATALAQWIRGMCTDEEDHVLIDAKLWELVDVLTRPVGPWTTQETP